MRSGETQINEVMAAQQGVCQITGICFDPGQ